MLLFLLIVGTNAVWADDYALNNPIGADGYYIVKWDCANSTWASSNSMQIGETFTFAIDITGNSYLLGIVNSGHTIAFAHYAGDGYAREYTADCFRLKQISGNIYGATYNFKKDKPDWDTQKIWARFWDGNNWDYPGKEIHSPTKNGLFKWATNTGATSPDFTPEQIAADEGMPNGHQRNGYAAPCACEETGGDPEPAENEYYVFGAGGTNWVTGWKKKEPEYKLTEEAGVYTKTFYNVKGSGLEFKVCDQNNNEFTWSNFNQTKSNFTCTQNGTNIDFNTRGTKNYQQYWDVTVHFDGSKIWVTRELSELGFSDNEFYVMGGGNNWTWDKNTKTDYNHLVKNGDVASVSYPGINGNCSFKVFRASDQYEINWDYYSASKSSGTTMINNGDDNIGRNFDGTKQLTIYFDGKNIWTDLSAPAITHTVIIHPNGGTAVDPLSVGDGQTISSISSTYGNGTAKWYKDEQLTQEFILGTSTVTSDMHLYAKWSVSGNYWLVGDQWMYDTGSTWNNGDNPAFTTTDGVATVTFIAPMGRNRFEIIKDNNWGQKINNGSYAAVVNSASPVAISVADGHMEFTLDEMKKVTIIYDGKVSVRAEAYDIHKTGWNIAGNSGLVGQEWDYSTCPMDNNGEKILRNINTGNYEFKITPVGGWGIAAVNQFSAANVDKDNSTSNIFRNWTSHLFGSYKDGNEYKLPMNNKKDRNVCIQLTNDMAINGKADIKIAFDGAKITVNVLPKYTVTFNSNGGNEVASQTMFEGRTASAPADPTKAGGYIFNGWKLNDVSYNFAAPVTDNIELVADWIAPTKHSVTFMDGETVLTELAQEVVDGQTATEPADPTKAGYIFSKWQLNGSDYNFSNPVTKDITLDAVWAYKPIESVSLNESTHMTWVGNSDFALTPTMAPYDLITQSVEWSSNKTSVATVSGGTVHAVGEGTATITCTVTDKSGTQKTATCEVTVAACQMIVNNLYSMTVTGYDSKTGDKADLSGLWNESSDNDGPEQFNAYYMRFSDNSTDGSIYAYDNNGVVDVNSQIQSDDKSLWYFISAGENVTPNFDDLDGKSFKTPTAVYYVRNVGTGKYLNRGTTLENTSGDNNHDWTFAQTLTSSNIDNTNVDNYKWIIAVPNSGAKYMLPLNWYKKSSGNAIFNYLHLHTCNQYNEGSFNPANYKKPHLICGRQSDNNRCHGLYNFDLNSPIRVDANPNYKASLMNGSYYRMNTDATVRANLNAALVSGAVITVRLYADAATTVKLQKTDGTEIETIDLTADTEREYTYTGSALVGESAFVIKAKDNHAGIASIVVTRTYAAHPASPELTWDVDTDVTQSALEPAFQHIASSHLSSGAITYTSSNPTVATVAADGTVTPLNAGNTTITATIEEKGCYGEAYITYNVTLNEPSLQEAINATAVSGTLPLTHDYNENAVINKAITINGQGHTIGDLKIELSGDLTLNSGLKVRDFTICAKAGNTDNHAASGQVRNADKLNVSRNAYFLYTVDPSGRVQYGWYDFTVPFPVNVMTGIAGIDENSTLKEDFVNERDYAIMEYLGERKAQGQYPYQKFRSVMQPNKLYSITLDSRDNYNTVRFQKTADGDLVASNTVTLNEYTGSGTYTNLNGVGNGTLHHADAGISGNYVQVYQSGNKTFLTVDKTQYSFVVGTAFMVQATGTMTLSPATHGALLAPSRYESAPATAIQIAREGQPFLSQGNDYFSDQLFISASETGGQAYTLGTDLAKAGNIGNVNVPQIWTNAYNTKLCVHEAQLINGEASYNLSIYAPAADTYTLTSKNIPADYSLYLTQNGTMLTELNGTYTLDLNKGITTEYGLLLVETYKTPTGMEESGIRSQESGISKILHNGVLYILHNGKIYNAQGAKVK